MEKENPMKFSPSIFGHTVWNDATNFGVKENLK